MSNPPSLYSLQCNVDDDVKVTLNFKINSNNIMVMVPLDLVEKGCIVQIPDMPYPLKIEEMKNGTSV